MTENTTSTRRRFASTLAATLAGVPFLGGLFVALTAARTPSHTERPDRWPLCRLDEVPESGLLPRPVSYRVRRGPAVETVTEVVFVGRDPDTGEVIALSNRCTHLGCPVVLQPDDESAPLHCPCHDAHFSATGQVLDGPARRPLDRLPLEIPEKADGTIHLLLT
jgi:nitrite reductase/ring-hydroxylating ferredoxin subunit